MVELIQVSVTYILNENKQSSSRRNSSEKVKLKQKDQESGEDIKKRYTVGKNKYQKIRNDVELIKLIFPYFKDE